MPRSLQYAVRVAGRLNHDGGDKRRSFEFDTDRRLHHGIRHDKILENFQLINASLL